ncbi:hypothetical protein LCGC14_1103950 [marine sediment metagenome]|uniref:Uncharacterized protein n=1 Tax=marine sediment metagenome TaxID=412755 RepID=A0A0F9MWM9_9ZZZZ
MMKVDEAGERRYDIHLRKREARAAINPLTRLVHDEVLDGPRHSVEPHIPMRLGRPLVRRPGAARRTGYRRNKPHSGPIRTTSDESFCEKCGIGVDAGGFYNRAATGRAEPVPPERLEELRHYATEQEAIRAALR